MHFLPDPGLKEYKPPYTQTKVLLGILSEGKNSESYNDFDLVLGDPSAGPSYYFFTYDIRHLYSETGVANLGRADFGLLISKGMPPDMPLDDYTALPLHKGHTYAVRSREGGIALLYVFDVEFQPPSYRVFPPATASVKSIKFDWVYCLNGMPAAGTSVQPISWGQLKDLAPERRSTSQVYWE